MNDDTSRKGPPEQDPGSLTCELDGTFAASLGNAAAGGADKIQESVFLAKFFSRLLGEVLHFKADKLLFRVEGDNIVILLSSGDQDLKHYAIRKAWFPRLCSWLSERFSVLGKQNAELKEPPSAVAAGFDFFSTIRVAQDVVSFRVKKTSPLSGKHTLLLSEFRSQPFTAMLTELGVEGYSRIGLDQIMAAKSGVVVVCAPDEMNLTRSLASLLSLRDCHLLKSCSSPEGKSAVLEKAEESLIVTAMRSDDAVDALLSCKDLSMVMDSGGTLAVLCQGFVRKVCSECARPAAVDPKQIRLLPEGLQFSPDDTYIVGRGCDKCGHSGYVGLLGVQSVLVADAQVKRFLASAKDQPRLVEYIYQQGTKPLLEDGVQKIKEGKATIESLFELTKVMPSSYSKFLSSKQARLGANGDASKAAAGGGGKLAGRTGLAEKKVYQLDIDPGESVPVLSVKAVHTKPVILVVEDDLDQRAILDMVLKSANYEVRFAGDGIQGLASLKEAVPDLIVVDLMMPRMDGREFVSRLKLSDEYRDIPVLILTVVGDSDKEFELLDLGADDYCEKTIQRKVLLKRIENLLKRSR